MAGCIAVLLMLVLPQGWAVGEMGTAPEVRIPVEPLGYVAPNPIPAFYYRDLVELHFVDATHLLFAFAVKRLLPREDGCAVGETQRMVRVVVLELPNGRVVRQAEWELYDWNDFLWGLGGGQFLLRRCTGLETLDSTLQLHPLMEAPGKIEAVEFSRARGMMAVENDTDAKPVSGAVVEAMAGTVARQVNVAFVAMHPPKVLGRALLPCPGELPLVDGGILEALEGKAQSWDVVWTPLAGMGGERPVGTVESYCAPELTPVGDGVVAAAVCDKEGGLGYVGLGTVHPGAPLWRIALDGDRHMPRILTTRDGARFAIEAVHGKRHVLALDPMTSETVDGQTVDVYDTKTGARVGGVRMSPVYTAGRNVAFSPDGGRMAVLRDGWIEVYGF